MTQIMMCLEVYWRYRFMANYTDSTLNMKVYKDTIIISDPILVPDSG